MTFGQPYLGFHTNAIGSLSWPEISLSFGMDFGRIVCTVLDSGCQLKFASLNFRIFLTVDLQLGVAPAYNQTDIEIAREKSQVISRSSCKQFSVRSYLLLPVAETATMEAAEHAIRGIQRSRAYNSLDIQQLSQQIPEARSQTGRQLAWDSKA